MSDLIEDDGPQGNLPEFTVSELSGAVRRVVEGEFGHVRVRGEVGRVSRPRSGHLYLDLKDDRAVLAGIVWKGQAQRLAVQPEEGMEVVATGRLTTYPGQSRYQIIIDQMALAGQGALMALLDKRRRMLAAEGLFAEERKRPIPYLPRVIGVVTSPSGAVIRDILHRLSDRFPVRVLVWPVAVQGERCGAEVAAAIRGFSALPVGGAVPRPDTVIVARGGGSVEDLWGFNDEDVVRAAAASAIPLISAVGHETDTTLIDHAADRRAPTPTAAAEMAVPVRGELTAALTELDARRVRALTNMMEARRQRLGDLARALPRADQILAERRQRVDLAVARLIRPDRYLADLARQTGILAQRLGPALAQRAQSARIALVRQGAGLDPERLRERLARRRERFTDQASRLDPARQRTIANARDRLGALVRTLGAVGPGGTLARGYAVVRGADGDILTARAGIVPGDALSIRFQDGEVDAVAGGAPPPRRTARRPKAPPEDDQGTLF